MQPTPTFTKYPHQASGSESYGFSFAAMASPCELRLYANTEAEAKTAADAAINEVLRIEQKYSRYRDDSVVAHINCCAGMADVKVDAETAGLIDYAATAYEQSAGLFDITSGVLRRVWDFKSGVLPSDSAISDIKGRIGWHKVQWQKPFIKLPNVGMQIDFGGFGKEYAADAAARVCREYGIEHGLVELGGDICVVGPHPDGSPWQVGIRNPVQPEEALMIVPLDRGAMASSGDYERYMVVDGKRYSHILNPRTARPVEQGLASVSVVAPMCLLAGTGATIAMLKEERDAPAWLGELGLPHVYINTRGELRGSLVDGAAAESTNVNS